MSTRATHARTTTGGLLAAAALALPGALGTTGSARADILSINTTGITTTGEFGDPTNTVFTFTLGAGAQVTGLGYDVNLTAFDPSYLSEITVAFTPSDPNRKGFALAPGAGENNPGTGSFSSGGIVDLGLDFNVANDGILRVEFYETNGDPVIPNGVFNGGTLNVQYAAVPEPATYALMVVGAGLLLLGVQRARGSCGATVGRTSAAA